MKVGPIILALLFAASSASAVEDCGDLSVPEIGDDIAHLEKADDAQIVELANLLGGHSPGCDGWEELWKAIPGPGDSKVARLKAVRLLELLGPKGYLGCKDCLYDLWNDADPEVKAAAEKAAPLVDPALLRQWKAAPDTSQAVPGPWAQGPYLFVNPDGDAFSGMALSLSHAPTEARVAEIRLEARAGEAAPDGALILPFTSWHLNEAQSLTLSARGEAWVIHAEGAAFSILTQSAASALLLEAPALPFGQRACSVAFYDAAGRSLSAAYEALSLGAASDPVDAAAFELLSSRLAPEAARHLGLYSWELNSVDIDGDGAPEISVGWCDFRGSKVATQGTLALAKNGAAWTTFADLNFQASLSPFSVDGQNFVLAAAEPGPAVFRHAIYAVNKGTLQELFSTGAGDEAKNHDKTWAQFVRVKDNKVEIYRRLFTPGAGIQRGPHEGWGQAIVSRSVLSWDPSSHMFVQGRFEALTDDERVEFEKVNQGLGAFLR